MMKLLCIKQHISNIWSSIHEKVKQHWGWVGKKLCLYYKRSAYLCIFMFNFVDIMSILVSPKYLQIIFDKLLSKQRWVSFSEQWLVLK